MRPRLICFALALCTLLVYLPVGRHSFVVYDDPDYITENSVVQDGLTWPGVKWAFSTFHASNWHPLTWLSHMVDCECFGLDAGAHHIVNAVFHAINAGLLLSLLFRLTGALWPSAFVAALFAWHPLHVESVAWASERKDVLSTLFWLLTLSAYTKYVEGPGVKRKKQEESGRLEGEEKGTNASGVQSSKSKVQGSKLSPGPLPSILNPQSSILAPLRRPPYLLALAFLALGLMSKPMLVTLPFTLLLLDYWPLARLQSPISYSKLARLVAEKWPLFLLSAISCVITVLAQRAEAVVALEPYPLSWRLGNAAVSYVRYLLKTMWPANLAVIYPLPHGWPWSVVAGCVAILVVLSWVVWRVRQGRPHLLVGWLWFLGTLVPVIGLVQVGGQAMADRYTYIPLIGIFLGTAFEVRWWMQRKRLDPKATAPGGMLHKASEQTPNALIDTPLQRGGGGPREHGNRFKGLPHPGETVETVSGSLRHGTTSLKRGVNEMLRWQNVGWCETSGLAVLILFGCVALTQRQLRYWSDSRSLFAHTIAVTRENALAHVNLGVVLEEIGKRDEALQEYQTAVRLDPNLVQAHNNLANLLMNAGKLTQALDEYNEALRLKPTAPLIHENLGTVLVKLGRFDEALRHYEEANRLTPLDARPHYLIAKALLRQGRSAEAVLRFREALRLDPNHLQTLVYFARVLAADENPTVRNGPEAVRLAEHANALLGTEQPFLLDTLAMAYAETGRFDEARQAGQRALDRATANNEQEAVTSLRQHLDLFLAHQPCREAFTNAPPEPSLRQ
jgi:tetratricopeptide (TPR) repeat protein